MTTAMIEPIGRAAAAYAGQTANLTKPGVAASASSVSLAKPVAEAAPVAESGPGSFTAYMGQQIKGAVNTLKTSESASIAAVAGKASAQEVVRSVMAAEMTVQAVVSIRDRMVSAYQDIMRMAI